MPSEDNDLHNEPDSADAEAEVDGPLLVSFSGELDISTVEAVRERPERRELLDATAVHVDLTEAFIDSSTIGLLVSACNRINAVQAGRSQRDAISRNNSTAYPREASPAWSNTSKRNNAVTWVRRALPAVEPMRPCALAAPNGEPNDPQD